LVKFRRTKIVLILWAILYVNECMRVNRIILHNGVTQLQQRQKLLDACSLKKDLHELLYAVH